MLEDYAHDSMQTTVEPEQRAAFDTNRSGLLGRLGLGAMAGTGLGVALAFDPVAPGNANADFLYFCKGTNCCVSQLSKITEDREKTYARL